MYNDTLPTDIRLDSREGIEIGQQVDLVHRTVRGHDIEAPEWGPWMGYNRTLRE